MTLFSLALLCNPMSYASDSVPDSVIEIIDAPSGLRPCCAFGINMKSKLSVIPVPFFTVNNIVQIADLSTHHYNDGTQGVIKSLLGKVDEVNGLIYTSRGGIIDTAHVRDTGDNTFYIYKQLQNNLGHENHFVLEAELRHRVINLHSAPVNLSIKEKIEAEIYLSGLLAFRLAQWHEVAQWFGFTSVAGFKEYPSAYSPEDLYSNMLGAKIAIEVIQNNPNLTLAEYQTEYPIIFLNHLKALGAKGAARTAQIMHELDGGIATNVCLISG